LEQPHRLSKSPNKWPFLAENSAFWTKNGQNLGFAFTDSSICNNYKLLFPCKLKAMERQENVLHRVGGGGRPVWGQQTVKGGAKVDHCSGVKVGQSIDAKLLD
jgi:hypothetical protein